MHLNNTDNKGAVRALKDSPLGEKVVQWDEATIQARRKAREQFAKLLGVRFGIQTHSNAARDVLQALRPNGPRVLEVFKLNIVGLSANVYMIYHGAQSLEVTVRIDADGEVMPVETS